MNAMYHHLKFQTDRMKNEFFNFNISKTKKDIEKSTAILINLILFRIFYKRVFCSLLFKKV